MSQDPRNSSTRQMPSSETSQAQANPVLAWLHSDGARFRETSSFLEALAQALNRSGIDVARISTGVPILHPQLYSVSSLWEKGKPVTERRFRLEEGGRQRFQNSPMAVVYAGGTVRSRIGKTAAPDEYPVIADLRAEGMTDYLALPLAFSDRSFKAVTFTTQQPGGFADEQVALLEELVPTLAMVLEIQTMHRTALTLLDTYVGRSAGRRVLDGAIKRGMVETIRAIIWTCDLRGFTELSGQLPGTELVALLDDYFGAMTDAVGHQGGEVLKFIGDAMLAIFPLSSEAPRLVARRALAAAEESIAAIDALNAERKAAGRRLIRFGLALHAGDVLYGNIGGTERLDFTVIGQAVNVATRIEGLTKELGRTVLLSSEMAALCDGAVEPLGRFPLKGVDAEQAVFAPASAHLRRSDK